MPKAAIGVIMAPPAETAPDRPPLRVSTTACSPGSSLPKKLSHSDAVTAAAVPTNSTAASTAAIPRFIHKLRCWTGGPACSAIRASVRADLPASVNCTWSNSL